MRYLALLSLLLLVGCNSNYYHDPEAPYVFDSFLNIYVPNPKYGRCFAKPVNKEDAMYKLGLRDGKENKEPRFLNCHKYMAGYKKGLRNN